MEKIDKIITIYVNVQYNLEAHLQKMYEKETTIDLISVVLTPNERYYECIWKVK